MRRSKHLSQILWVRTRLGGGVYCSQERPCSTKLAVDVRNIILCLALMHTVKPRSLDKESFELGILS